MQEKYVIGVDVGTGSARAGVFDARGRLLAQEVRAIQMWKPRPAHAEQSSQDIWRAVCECVRQARAQAGLKPEEVAGISFDATCSLVVLDKAMQPLAVNEEGRDQRNVIVWMDQRALEEAEEINAGQHEVLQYVGGRISPEMETPKLLWLKRHLASTYERAGKFFDLADFLTWRASGVDARSLCTLVCKWTYLGHENRWDQSYFRSVGLGDLFQNERVSSDVRAMGSPLGPLTEQAARDLGLASTCTVGVGIIDAHAGGLGVLGALWSEGSARDGEARELSKLETALALIGGTSNCHMAVSREARFVPGVWGPYFGAMVPEMWLAEGGQSAAGSAIDFVIQSHPASAELSEQAAREKKTVYETLNALVEKLQAIDGKGPAITRDFHVLPDFLGNRSPHADPHARALFDGLSLDDSLENLALRYYATLQSVAYGTRDIVRAMNEAGFCIETIFATGGGTKNPLWLQEHADATGCRIVLAEEGEAVLLGSAMLAAVAGGLFADVAGAMAGMSRAGKVIEPRAQWAAYHEAKFEVFRALQQEQRARRDKMSRF